MTFKFKGEQYRISFQHGMFPLPLAPDKSVRGTRCSVGPEGQNNIGYSWCSPQDNFRRETGRKVALKRALLWYGGSSWRAFRTAAWKAYLERPR